MEYVAPTGCKYCIDYYSFANNQAWADSYHHFGELNSETFHVFNAKITPSSGSNTTCSVVSVQPCVISLTSGGQLRKSDS